MPNGVGSSLASLIRTKTFWAGVALVVSGIAGVVTSEQNWAQAGQSVFMGLAAIFLRQSVAKGPDGSQDPALPKGGLQ